MASESSSRRALWQQEVRNRLAGLQLAPTREAEIVDELTQHLDDYYCELLSAGTSPEDAEALTLAECREGRLARDIATLRQAHTVPPPIPAAPGAGMFSGVWQDLRGAIRLFVKQPAFAVTAVITLALGVGATTAIFSVVNGVLLKPLPFADPDRLVSLKQSNPHGAGRNHGPATYLTFRENQQAFEDIGAWDGAEVSLTGGGNPERVEALRISASTLPLLRVEPIIGRSFTSEDDVPGGPMRTMLTHGYWQRRFGGNPAVIGQQLVVDGTPAEIIGVLPASFSFLRARPEILLPMPLDATAPRFISFGFQALARLKPGVTLEQANADVARLIGLLPPMFARLELGPDVRPLADDVIGNIGDVLWILLGAVGVVLLVACGNVANLFLIRAEVRQQELAMRAALGASRGRLARTLLSESGLLGIGGGLLGLVFAQAAIAVLRRFAPAELPRVDDIAIDGTVLVVTLVVSILSGMFFGLFAVTKFGSPSLGALKDGGRSTTDAPVRARTRDALVVAQVAFALVLLTTSGLMMRTFLEMRQVDPGFQRPEEVQTFVVAIPRGTIADDGQAARTHQSVAERIAQMPGVTSVGLSSSITMDGEDNGNVVDVEGFNVPDGTVPPLRRFKSVGPGYFETMGNRLAAGRPVTWSDILEQRPVIVISEPLAREYWGEPANALGKRIRGSSRAPWREVIGVSGPERDDGLNHPATAIVYWPMLNESYRWRTMSYAIRSSRVGTPGFLAEVQRAVWSVNPDLPIANVQTLAQIRATSMAQTSFATVMLAIAATVALLIGTVGIYGAIAYAATQRTREIGIRMALGAQIRDVHRLFLRHGLAIACIGIVVGLAVSLGITRVMASFLYGVGPIDPVTFAGVSALVAAVAVLAIYVPARRAARVDPTIALRADM